MLLSIQKKNGKHFLVGVEFNQTERGISVSDVRGIFDKETPSWMNWITQGKMIYGNKEKIQSVIAEQRTTLAEVNYLKLDSINNVLEKYPNVNNIFTNEDSIYENAVEEEWKKYPTAYTELKLLPSERERIINSYNPALQGNYRIWDDLL